MRYWLLAATGLVFVAPVPAFATTHTLDFSGDACDGGMIDPAPCHGGITNTPISSTYGDDATIDISHRTLTAAGTTVVPFLVWKDRVGDLTNVAYGVANSTELAEIRFAPAAGYEVSLTSFDIACSGTTSCGAFAYSVLTGSGALLASDSAVITAGNFHFSFSPDTDYFDEPLLLRWTNSESLGIDNIVFDVRAVAVQEAVPEPASWALLLGGFGVVGGAMRRRRSEMAAA